MFSDLTTLRSALLEQIGPALPESWTVKPGLTGEVQSLVPVLYTEFKEIQTTDPSGDLPHGQASAVLDLIIVEPQTGDGAEDAVDGHITYLLGALDASSDIHWETARKERLDSGSLGWRVSLRALVSTTT